MVVSGIYVLVVTVYVSEGWETWDKKGKVLLLAEDRLTFEAVLD